MGHQYDCQVREGGKAYHDEAVQKAELHYEG